MPAGPEPLGTWISRETPPFIANREDIFVSFRLAQPVLPCGGIRLRSRRLRPGSMIGAVGRSDWNFSFTLWLGLV